MAKQTTKVDIKPNPEVVNTRPKHEIDIENLQKIVEHLEEKVKSQAGQMALLLSNCESCEKMMKELRLRVRKAEEVAGIAR